MSPPRYRTEIIHIHPPPITSHNLSEPIHRPSKKYSKILITLIFSIFLIASLSYISLQIQKLSPKCLDRYLLTNQKANFAGICSKFTSFSSASRVVHDLGLVRSSSLPLFNSIFLSDPFSQESLSSLQTSLERLNESTSDLDGQLLLAPQTRQTPAWISISQKISRLRQTIGQLVQLSPQLPRLLAVNSNTSFLVLIQDSTELRSSGGFVDTLAYFTLSNTHLTSSRYYSSSSLPATSPSPLLWQKITRQSSWQIRDANFDPNFPTSAKEIARLFTSSTSLPVDYVIAINLSTLEKILDYTGPITLPDIPAPISSQNLVSSYLEYLSQTGSRNLFLSSLVAAISSHISRLPTASQINVFYYLLSQFQSRQIFISPVSIPWDGSLFPPSCPFASCFSDFIIPVENHIGLNKSSAYLIRSASLSQSFSPHQIESEYRLTLENTSPSSIWPAGSVKNYFQLFLPQSSSIDSVSAQHTVSSRSGFSVISLIVDIPPGQTRNISVVYHLPPSLSSYRFTYLPQPGLLNFSFTHTLNFPASWSVTTHQTPAVAQPGRLQYNSRTPNPHILDLDINQ